MHGVRGHACLLGGRFGVGWKKARSRHGPGAVSAWNAVPDAVVRQPV
ncbi:hypothetical protein [Polaromonas sp. CG9_12]|nr:hypothetical protein [Polaromonas sp. CG9_12]